MKKPAKKITCPPPLQRRGKKTVAKKRAAVKRPARLLKRAPKNQKIAVRIIKQPDEILNSFTVRYVPDYVLNVRIIKDAPIQLDWYAKYFAPLARPMIKITTVLLIVMLNWFGLSAVGRTLAYYHDSEASQGFLLASSLDFTLNGDDFTPLVTTSQNATSTLDISNDGLMDFNYKALVKQASGTLCAFLELEDNLTNLYLPLNDFISSTTAFTLNANLIFDARLASSSKALQNQTCEFKLAVEGEQIEGAGFSDTEEVSRVIRTGEWPGVVINKVYYHPDEQHKGNLEEWKYEWIELYNPLDQAVNLKDWQICDDAGCKTIHANVDIPALGYALLSHDNSLWQQYWEVPDGVETINLGNAPPHLILDNTADMLVLLNSDGGVVDQMNWGTPDQNWTNYAAYSGGIWEPGLVVVPENQAFGRQPNGYDTDAPSDFISMGMPSVLLLNPDQSGTLIWYWTYFYPITWTATNPNGPDSDLKVNLSYILDSDYSTTLTPGDQVIPIASELSASSTYVWMVPPGFIGYIWIKVVVTGPENIMLNSAIISGKIYDPFPEELWHNQREMIINGLRMAGLISKNYMPTSLAEVENIISSAVGLPTPAPSIDEVEASSTPPSISPAIPDDNTGTTTPPIIEDGTATTTDPILDIDETGNSTTTPEIVDGPATSTVEIIPITESPVENTVEILPALENPDDITVIDEPIANGPALSPETSDSGEVPPDESAIMPEPAASPEPAVEAPTPPEPTPEPAATPETPPAPDSVSAE